MKSQLAIYILVAVLGCAVAALADGSIGNPTTAVNLRAKPRTTSKVRAIVRPDDILVIDQTRGRWYHVRVRSTGTTGWVSRQFVALTEVPSQIRADSEIVDHASDTQYIPTTPIPPKAQHSMIRIHNAVIKAFEDLAQTLLAQNIPFARFGDEYDPPRRLLVVFGEGASIADLRAVVNATGPSPDLYLAAIGDEDFRNSIVVGIHGGEGYKSAKLQDVYDALQGAVDIDDLATEIARKGKRQR